MSGPCLCGDYMCPSCGPEQVYDPKFEALCEKLAERLDSFLRGVVALDGPQMDDLLETIVNKISTMKVAEEADYERKYYAQLKEEERLANE
jgi:hypothetical protein